MEILLFIILIPLAIMLAPFWINIIVLVLASIVGVFIGIWKFLTSK